MKKLLSLVALAGLTLGAASVAMAATDVKVKGTFDFGFGLYQGTSFTKHDGQENFDASQRFRSQIDFVASESLKGVARFEIGNLAWGAKGGATYGWGSNAGRGVGGAMGADGVNVEVKNLYLDWVAPQTDLQIRMGVQGYALPQAVYRAGGGSGGAVLDDDLAGILLSYDFTEEVGATLGWFRPWNPYVYGDKITRPEQMHDAIDLVSFTLPIEFKDQFSFTPYFMYAFVGQIGDKYDPQGQGVLTRAGTIGDFLSANSGLGSNGNAWWTGFALDLSYFKPFVAGVDFMYGSYSADKIEGGSFNYGDIDPDRSGWAVVSKFGYQLDYFTPVVFGWYGSGSDDFWKKGQDGVMPVLSPDWGLTSVGFTDVQFAERKYLIGATPAGTWAIGVGLDDIKFIDNLTSQLRVAYFEGTSSIKKDNTPVGKNAFMDYGVLGTKDHGFEVNLDNVYKIYENLSLYAELGYINLSLKEQPDDFQKNAFKGYVGFRYSF